MKIPSKTVYNVNEEASKTAHVSNANSLPKLRMQTKKPLKTAYVKRPSKAACVNEEE